jgi:hypothetical protein
VAGSVAASEAFHEVGAPGEPGFQNGWQGRDPSNGKQFVGFYKDRVGVVHLKGAADGPLAHTVIFQLPPGYRPPAGREWVTTVPCGCVRNDNNGDAVPFDTGQLTILGDGSVILQSDANTASTNVSFDGVTFPAGG